MNTDKPKEREHKDVTCAVRIPPSLYLSLKGVASITQSSLSDIIREAITEKIEQIKTQELEKRLKREELRQKINEIASKSSDDSAKDRLDDILDLLDAG